MKSKNRKKRNIYLKKIRLESAINQLQNSEEYTKMEMIVKQQVDKVLGEDKQLLRLAFESITESLLKDPFRLLSYFQYAMSVTPTSTLSYTLLTLNMKGNEICIAMLPLPRIMVTIVSK